ncbi:MAG: hypothetical protein WC342_03625 [Methanoregula sp.]
MKEPGNNFILCGFLAITVLLVGSLAILLLWGCPLPAPTALYTGTNLSFSPVLTSPAPGESGDSATAGNGAVSVTRTFPYVLNGETGTISINLPQGVYDELSADAPTVMCSPDNSTVPCTSETFTRFYRNMSSAPAQQAYLDTLVREIENKTPAKDDQARIAISIVQHIPYGYNVSAGTGGGAMRYPYMVLYDDNGMCDEKSVLLASLLRGLGYGTALLDFSSDNHMVLGIKSPAAYAYNGTGYAFVETTIPLIVTDDQELYNNGTKLSSVSDIYPISDGASFDAVSDEYNDSREFIRLTKSGRYTGSGLRASDDPALQPLVQKYGLNLNQAA